MLFLNREVLLDGAVAVVLLAFASLALCGVFGRDDFLEFSDDLPC